MTTMTPTSSPLAYIFGIIDHIKKRIINDLNNNNYHTNYINNNINNYNSDINNIVIKAVGPCVRNLLRNESITDISMVISSFRIKDELISLLQVMELLNYYETVGDVQNIHFTYRTKIYKLQISHNVMKLDLYKHNCGFTCDNLSIDFDGNISTVYTHNQVNHFTNVSWINSCIQDVLANKFRVLLYDSMDTIEKINQINQMFNVLTNEGFAYDKSNSLNLTHFQFVEMKHHTDIKTFAPNRDVSFCCGICHEKYEDEPQKNTILVACLHDFHVDCLQKWISKSSPQNCPICRAYLKFEPKIGYGDEQVDHIIENLQY